ncbi:MAG: hypothetical protein JWP09_803 [Candidatus Taylorbacteria bacterium]|nr:hypothetical protein [Candidatus Taylorbacteria bacterium]
MKNTQRNFILFIILAVAVIGGGVYFYSTKKASTDLVDTQFHTEADQNANITSLPDTSFKSAVGDLDANILARGDVNGDGYEDAVVQEIHCGASCSVSLQVVLNEGNVSAKLVKDKNYPDTFSPAYVASSAIKSEVTSVSIKNGIISLTGKGLACTTPSLEEACTEEKWNVIKTATYKFDGSNIVQLSVKP